MKISAVIITKDEASSIERTLQSLQWCDEIVIVDSGSTDNTQEICKRYTDRIYYKKFNGFGEQKQYAVSLAINDWILAIDADEVIPEALFHEINTQLPLYSSKCNGFYLTIELFFLGKQLRFGGSRINHKLRLFNKKFGNFNQRPLHEFVELQGKIRYLKKPILHLSYINIHDYIAKFNRYTDMAAKEILGKNKVQSCILIMIRWPLEFFRRYILMLGFLDGFPGFLWSLLCSIYPVIKKAKAWEKRKNLHLSKKNKNEPYRNQIDIN